jgi:hypothetical protein
MLCCLCCCVLPAHCDHIHQQEPLQSACPVDRLQGQRGETRLTSWMCWSRPSSRPALWLMLMLMQSPLRRCVPACLLQCLLSSHALTPKTSWFNVCLQVVYSVLEPNSTRRYHTYTTHPWIVRELHTGTRMMLSGCPAVVGLSTEQTVEIAAPPKLQWSVSTPSTPQDSHQQMLRRRCASRWGPCTCSVCASHGLCTRNVYSWHTVLLSVACTACLYAAGNLLRLP